MWGLLWGLALGHRSCPHAAIRTKLHSDSGSAGTDPQGLGSLLTAGPAVWGLAVCTRPPPATLRILILAALPTHRTHSFLGLRVPFSRVTRCPCAWCPGTCSTRRQPGTALPSQHVCLPQWFEFGHLLSSASGYSVRCESLGSPPNQAPRLGGCRGHSCTEETLPAPGPRLV